MKKESFIQETLQSGQATTLKSDEASFEPDHIVVQHGKNTPEHNQTSLKLDQRVPLFCKIESQPNQVNLQLDHITQLSGQISPQTTPTCPHSDKTTAQSRQNASQCNNISTLPEKITLKPEQSTLQPGATIPQPGATILQSGETTLHHEQTVPQPEETTHQPDLERKFSPSALAELDSNLTCVVKKDPLDFIPDEGLFTLPANFLKQEPVEQHVKQEVIECSISALTLVKSEGVTYQLFSAGCEQPLGTQVKIKCDVELPAPAEFDSLLAHANTSKLGCFLSPKLDGLASNISSICNERTLYEAILRMIPSENSNVTSAVGACLQADGFSTSLDGAQIDGDNEELYNVQKEVISLKDEANCEILPIIQPLQNYLKNNIKSLPYLKQNLSPVKNILKALKNEKFESYEMSNSSVGPSSVGSPSDGFSNVTSHYPTGHPLVNILINLQKLPGIYKLFNIIQKGSICSINIIDGDPNVSQLCEQIFEENISEVLKPFEFPQPLESSKASFAIRTCSVIKYMSSGLSATLINPGTYIKLVNDTPSLFKETPSLFRRAEKDTCSAQSPPPRSSSQKQKRSQTAASDQDGTGDSASPQRLTKVSKSARHVEKSNYNLRRSSRKKKSSDTAANTSANSVEEDNIFSNFVLDDTLPDVELGSTANNKSSSPTTERGFTTDENNSSEYSSFSNVEEIQQENPSRATRNSRRNGSRGRTALPTKTRPSTNACEVQQRSGESDEPPNMCDSGDSNPAKNKRKHFGKATPDCDSVAENTSIDCSENKSSPARKKRKQERLLPNKAIVSYETGTPTDSINPSRATVAEREETGNSDMELVNVEQEDNGLDDEIENITKEREDIEHEKRRLMEKMKEYEEQQQMIEKMKQDLLRQMESIGSASNSVESNEEDTCAPSLARIVASPTHNKSPSNIVAHHKSPNCTKVLGNEQGWKYQKNNVDLGISKKASECVGDIIESNEPIVTDVDEVISEMNAGSFSLDNGLEVADDLLPHPESLSNDFVTDAVGDVDKVPAVIGDYSAEPASSMDCEQIVSKNSETNTAGSNNPQNSNSQKRSTKAAAGSKSSLRFFRNHSESPSNDSAQKSAASNNHDSTAVGVAPATSSLQQPSRGLQARQVKSCLPSRLQKQPIVHYLTDSSPAHNKLSSVKTMNNTFDPNISKTARQSSRFEEPSHVSNISTTSSLNMLCGLRQFQKENVVDSAGNALSNAQICATYVGGRTIVPGFHKVDKSNINRPNNNSRGLTCNTNVTGKAGVRVVTTATNSTHTITGTNMGVVRGLNTTTNRNNVGTVSGPTSTANNTNNDRVSSLTSTANNTSSSMGNIRSISNTNDPSTAATEISDAQRAHFTFQKETIGATALSVQASTAAKATAVRPLPCSAQQGRDDDYEEDDYNNDDEEYRRVVLGKVPSKDESVYLSSKLILLSETMRQPGILTSKGTMTVPCLQLACDDVTLYACPECYYMTNCRFRYRTHYYVHSSTQYKCRICEYSSKHKEKTLQHEARHGSVEEIKCEICNYVCFLKKGMLRHNKIHLDPTAEDPRCRKCSYVGRNFQDIRCHVLLEHGIKGLKLNLECILCPNQRALSFCSLGEHVATHMNSTGEYKCPQCAFCDPDQMTMQDHVRLHSKVLSYQCDLCTFQGKTRKMLTEHLNVHCQPQPLKCTLCEYIATDTDDLDQHVITHSSKTYTCNICDFVCYSLSDLLNHKKRQHLDSGAEDPEVSCPACNSFRTRQNCDMKKHLLMQHDFHGGMLMATMNKLYSAEYRRPKTVVPFHKVNNGEQETPISAALKILNIHKGLQLGTRP